MATDDKLSLALARTSESATVDFKSALDLSTLRDLLEIIEDFAAFANSGGGTILVGLNDDGSPSEADVRPLLKSDPANFSNQIHKYTGQNFSGFEFKACEKQGRAICAIEISPVRVPIVFSRVGEMELPDAKKKTIFALGTVYFRHGAKSEPGTSQDLSEFLERELENTRSSWLDGIKKVVEAPPGSKFAVLPFEATPTATAINVSKVTLAHGPNAEPHSVLSVDTTHPYRQKEVVSEVNRRLNGARPIVGHDVFCVRVAHAIDTQVSFCYIQKFASPRYSEQFVEWLVAQHALCATFFGDARIATDVARRANAKTEKH